VIDNSNSPKSNLLDSLIDISKREKVFKKECSDKKIIGLDGKKVS